ncbi:hypothetical protein GCM10020331_095890 [Ectobacillus funiculus]
MKRAHGYSTRFITRYSSTKKMATVKVKFDDTKKLISLNKPYWTSCSRSIFKRKIQPGMEIAIAVGSRGLDRLVEITAATVRFLQELGAKPFIVPSMGSHGGATAEGQREVLAHLGVTEESVNCEIRSSMEVVKNRGITKWTACLC